MKKNYLKPLCEKVPIAGPRLMEGSIRKFETSVDTLDDDNAIGLSRENKYESHSVWDD